MIKRMPGMLDSYEHGGNIYSLAAKLNIAEEKIIDFSASINPLGVSRKVRLEIEKWSKSLHNYPDPEANELTEKLCRYHNINPKTIICGNGSTELIYLIPRALKPKRALIPAPTFSEYERAVRTQDTEHRTQIKYFKLKEKEEFRINPDEFISAIKRDRSDMTFLCNPNNPNGQLLKKDDVLKIADAAKKLKCYLVVDEAFIDFCPDNTVTHNVADNPYLIVLRSMTKFYALSGVRIGYGVFPLYLIDRLKRFKEPWSVNSLAQKAASAAIGDNAYADKTFRLIRSEKKFLEDNFRNMGIEFFPSDANFYLLKIKGAKSVVSYLKKRGILVRDCSNFRGLDGSYIRVAVKSQGHNMLLLKELSKLCRA